MFIWKCIERELSESVVFFFNDTATTEIYTLSLHDALPISTCLGCRRGGPVGTGRDHVRRVGPGGRRRSGNRRSPARRPHRSEEHTSELQSRQYLVCRLLLEKKKTTTYYNQHRVFYLMLHYI